MVETVEADQELRRFYHYSIKDLLKRYKKNVMRRVYAIRIMKNIRNLRKVVNLSMVFGSPTYIGLVASCFFVTGVFAANFSVFASHSMLLSPFSFAFLIGLTAHESKRDGEPDSETNEGKKDKESSGRPKKKKEKGKEKDDILQFLLPAIDRVERLAKSGISVVAYLRVSTFRQVLGKSLECQERELRARAKQVGAALIYWIIDAGKSGRDFSARKLGMVLALAAAGKINKLVISEIDRIGRKSLQLLGFLLQLRGYGVTIVTPAQELDVEKLGDFIFTAVKAFAAEDQNNIRGYVALRSKVQAFSKRIWNLDVPIAYQKKKSWIAKVPVWDPIINKIFNLFLKYKSYGLVCKIVNDLFSGFLKKPLTRQQVRQILVNPVYVGKPRYCGEVAEKKFPDAVIVDHSLAYVSEDVFEKVQTVIAAKSEKYSRRKKPVEELVEAFGLEVLDFLPHVRVHCPRCNSEMRGGGGSDYVCPNCNKHLNPVKKTELQKIREWALNREKSLRVLVKLLKKYKQTGKKWKDGDIEGLLNEHKKNDGDDGEEQKR